MKTPTRQKFEGKVRKVLSSELTGRIRYCVTGFWFWKKTTLKVEERLTLKIPTTDWYVTRNVTIWRDGSMADIQLINF